MEGMRKKYGDVVGLFLGVQPAVLISGAEVVKEISANEEFAFKPAISPPQHKMFSHKRMGFK